MSNKLKVQRLKFKTQTDLPGRPATWGVSQRKENDPGGHDLSYNTSTSMARVDHYKSGQLLESLHIPREQVASFVFIETPPATQPKRKQ